MSTTTPKTKFLHVDANSHIKAITFPGEPLHATYGTLIEVPFEAEYSVMDVYKAPDPAPAEAPKTEKAEKAPAAAPAEAKKTAA